MGLPAAPATAALATATATFTTATTTSAAFTTEPAAPAASFARNHGTSFVDYQCPAMQIPPVAGFNGTAGRGVIVDFYKSESASFACEAIAHHS
jgi:hypothetical protein